MEALAKKDEDKLSSAVAKMREKREAEMRQMKQNRAGNQFRKVAAGLAFVNKGKKDETDSSAEKIGKTAVAIEGKNEENNDTKNASDEQVKQPNVDKSQKTIDKALAKKDEEKLADTVMLLRKQREEEMKQMKQNKAAESGRNLVAKLSEGKADVSGVVQEMHKERDKEIDQSRLNKIISPHKSHIGPTKPKKAIKKDESTKHQLKKENIGIKSKELSNAMHAIPRSADEASIETSGDDKKSDGEAKDLLAPAKNPDILNSSITEDRAMEKDIPATPTTKIRSSLTPPPSSRRKGVLPSSLTAESKKKKGTGKCCFSIKRTKICRNGGAKTGEIY